MEATGGKERRRPVPSPSVFSHLETGDGPSPLHSWQMYVASSPRTRGAELLHYSLEFCNCLEILPQCVPRQPRPCVAIIFSFTRAGDFPINKPGTESNQSCGGTE